MLKKGIKSELHFVKGLYRVEILRKCLHSLSNFHGSSSFNPIPPSASIATLMSIIGFIAGLTSEK